MSVEIVKAPTIPRTLHAAWRVLRSEFKVVFSFRFVYFVPSMRETLVGVNALTRCQPRHLIPAAGSQDHGTHAHA